MIETKSDRTIIYCHCEMQLGFISHFWDISDSMLCAEFSLECSASAEGYLLVMFVSMPFWSVASKLFLFWHFIEMYKNTQNLLLIWKIMTWKEFFTFQASYSYKHFYTQHVLCLNFVFFPCYTNFINIFVFLNTFLIFQRFSY